VTVPIIGAGKTWKNLAFKFGVMMGKPADPDDDPILIGYQFGIFAERSDGLPFGATFSIDPAKIEGDPIAAALRAVNAGIIALESFRECSCVADRQCLLHATTPGMKQ
jgi:hypothetical protein